MSNTGDALKYSMNANGGSHTEDRLPITIWVPGKYKSMYDHCQKLTKNDFGKWLKSIVIQAIENSSKESA